MTTTTEHTGTERYLAPELVIGDADVNPTAASDVYALGCLGLEVGIDYVVSPTTPFDDLPVYISPEAVFSSQKQLSWDHLYRYEERCPPSCQATVPISTSVETIRIMLEPGS